MPWLMAALYDRMMRTAEKAGLGAWRADLLRDLSGHVLEAGAGTGVNLQYYPTAVERLVLVEPDPKMRSRLIKKLRGDGMANVEVIDATLESLPVGDATFDAVVSTLVLCSVRDLDVSLREAYRVLKPGGRLVFLEHVAAEDRPTRLKWQQRVEPIWKRLAGNCHLTRHTAQAIAAAGFDVEACTRESMRKAMALVRPTVRGVAVKPAS